MTICLSSALINVKTTIHHTTMSNGVNLIVKTNILNYRYGN